MVDTSVAAKWFFDEPLSEPAVAILESARSHDRPLVAPDLIYPELGNVVRKRVVRDGLDPEEGALIVAAFARLPFADVIPGRPLLAGSYRLALTHGCTVYDAVFLATARQVGGELVTADERFYRAVVDGAADVTWLGDL